MKMRPHPFLMALLLILGQSHQAPAQSVQDMSAYLDSAANMGLFSGNVLVEREGSILMEKSLGQADIEAGTPNQPGTPFHIASITKDFTKLILLKLMADGRLHMTDSLGAFLTGFSPTASGIQIHQLMYFTSGMGDYHRADAFQTNPGKQFSIAEALDIIRREPLLFKPGTSKAYSNSGYVVLAAIIEKVTGKRYATCLQDMIFTPLHMTHTGIAGAGTAPSSLAKGYLSNAIGPLQQNKGITISGTGDGGIYTDTHDLLAFIHAVFFDKGWLSDSARLQMVARDWPSKGAAGWAEFQQKGRHASAGGAPGINAVYSVNMAKKEVIIVLSNFDMGSAETIQQGLAAQLRGEKAAPLRQPPSRALYAWIKEHGGAQWESRYKEAMSASGMEMDDDMVLLDVGMALRANGDLNNALSLYRVYTNQFPNIIIAWNELGECYALAGDKEKARSCFQKVLEIQPGNRRASSNLQKLGQ